MKLQFQKDALISSINIAIKAVPSKSTMPIMECLLLDASNGKICLVGNDTEFGIETVCRGEILEAGKVALDARLFSEIIKKLLEECASNGKLPEGKKQTGKASYTKIIAKEDCRIDWMKSAAEIDAKIRAYFPEPGAWTEENGAPLKILSARISDDIPASSEVPGTVLSFDKKRGILVQTGSGIIAVTELQRQGKKALDAPSFINGARNFIGTVLR